MKKVLFILPLLCLALTGCDVKNSVRDYYRVQMVEQKGAVFCHYTQDYNITEATNGWGTCTGCLEYKELKTYLNSYNTISLTCTTLTEGCHIHYCLVYSEK